MHRRQFLTFSLPALAVGVAGCSSPQQESTGVVIQTLELENHSGHDAIFDVTIQDEDEETAFETEQAVEGDSTVSLAQPTDEPGHYTIQLTTDGQTLAQDASMFAEAGDSCVIAVGRLDQAERLRIEGNGYDDCTN